MEECEYCGKYLSTVYSLKRHQLTTISCLLIQKNLIVELEKVNDIEGNEQTDTKDMKIQSLKKELALTKLQLKNDSKHQVVINNINTINNTIINMTPLTTNHIKETYKNLTYDNIKNGDNYGLYMYENPLKDRITVRNRKDIIYKNGDKDNKIVTDPYGSDIIQFVISLGIKPAKNLIEEKIKVLKCRYDKEIKSKYHNPRELDAITDRTNKLVNKLQDIKDIAAGGTNKFKKEASKRLLNSINKPENGFDTVIEDDDD